MTTELHQEGRFYRLSTGRAAHYENIKPHNPSTEDWCIPADMEEGDYLMMDPACEVNEKGTREKNDGNEVVKEGASPPLDLDPNEVIEADEETLPYAEEDWQDPEQMEVPKNLEPDLPFTIQTRQNDRTRSRKKYNPYGDDFVVARIDLKKIVEEVVGLEEITVSQDIDLVDDHDKEWVCQGFANHYHEFIKGYADKVYPMQKLMRNKGKKFEWSEEAQTAFENIKRELCEAPVLGMPTEKGMYVLDTDSSVVAISGILH